MAKYLLAYHGGKMPETGPEQAKATQAWTDWYTGLGNAVVDRGNPVGQATTIAADGSVSPGGGAKPVSGYTIIEAGNLDAAVQMATGCPVRSGGGSIEVAETVNIM